MKRWFRAVAYSTIAVLAALALFGGKTPADASIVESAPRRDSTRMPTPDAGKSDGATTGPALATVHRRLGQSLPVRLFSVDRPEPPPTSAPPPSAPMAPAVPDVKVLGWMQSEGGPFVFVEWNNESHTLKPTESIDEAYRFDRVEAGFADFTYLPTGESRRYTVSDPALLE